MQTLKIALVQADQKWEDKAGNLALFEERLNDIQKQEERPDIIVLPEMFTTAFTMEPEKLAEGMDGEGVNWMQRMARKLNAIITGSLIIKESGAYFNRLIWMMPDGSMSFYNKRHLFSMAGEEKVYFPGTEKLIVEYKGWKICPVVCYDLRFPVWLRNTERYDVLIVAANWPERRIQHWRKLLQARAIENQCYVAGVNRVGVDGNQFNYSGSTMYVDPMGEILSELVNEEGIILAELQREVLTHTRRYMPFLNDMDSFTIDPTPPQAL
jgi:predicted amidohydrolase